MFLPRSIEELVENQLDLPFDRVRGVLTGGCLGLMMSVLFSFVFFATGIALIAGIEGSTFQIRGLAVIPVGLLGLSALLSPIIGLFMGLRNGYAMTQHCGCFILYIGFAIAGVIVLSLVA